MTNEELRKINELRRKKLQHPLTHAQAVNLVATHPRKDDGGFDASSFLIGYMIADSLTSHSHSSYSPSTPDIDPGGGSFSGAGASSSWDSGSSSSSSDSSSSSSSSDSGSSSSSSGGGD